MRLSRRRFLLAAPFLGLAALAPGSEGVLRAVLDEAWGSRPVTVVLEVPLPRVEADTCSVRVYGFPSLSRPGLRGRLVAAQTARPGSLVEVRDYFKRMVAVAHERGEPVWEPQEYLVIASCVKREGRRGRRVAGYTATVEARPRGGAVRLRVSPGPGPVEPWPGRVVDVCEFTGGGCTAETRVGLLHAVEGLEAGYRVYAYPYRSGVYLSSFAKPCILFDWFSCECLAWGPWEEAGKKLAMSLVTHESGWLRGPGSGYVTGSVGYEAELLPGWSGPFAGACIDGPAWLLYPATLGGLVDVYPVGAYAPPPPSGKVYGPLRGDLEIAFGAYGHGDRGVRLGVSSAISFCHPSWGCVSLNVALYRAGRWDSQVGTPSLLLRDISGNTRPWYRWWFQGGDPMSYEVHVRG